MMHLSVIAKSPVAGLVKTRLCPPCSGDQAAQIAKAALVDTLRSADEVARDAHARRVLLLDGERQAWMPDSFEIVSQRGTDLAARLCNGFVDLGPGVIVGMETPHVVEALGDALCWAERGIDSIGLAIDGGYWMIGLCAASAAKAAQLFSGVPMSQSHTGLAQLRRMHANGCAVRLLPTARDLDSIVDLRAVAVSGRGGELVRMATEVLAAL